MRHQRRDESVPQQYAPHEDAECECKEHGTAAGILGVLAHRMNFRPDAVDGGFHGGIQKFGHEQKHEREDGKELEREGCRDEKEGDESDNGQNGFLPESFFALAKPSRE